MQLDITNLFQNAPLRDYSASNQELGEGAGAFTWANAQADCADWLPAFNAEELETLRDHLAGYGGWSRDEMAEWSAQECSALMLQFIAGDIRESGMDTNAPDWDEYEKGANSGRYSGRFYRGDDGRVYYYVGY